MIDPQGGRRRNLPRLLYVGDVPIESSVAGASLLYRLFDGYPADRLVVCQSDRAATRVPECRLQGVRYHEFSLGSTKPLYTRFARYYAAYMLMRAPRRAASLAAELDEVPDAVVTVAHGFSWLTAAAIARQYRVPLHLIVHDECLATMGVAAPMRAFANAQFVRTYRAATTRFCVSPGMRDYYDQRTGVAGDVLYPSRARDATVYSSPAHRVSRSDGPFTVAFAGSLNLGYVDLLARLAGILEDMGGRLDLYGAEPPPALRLRLASPAVSFHRFLPSGELSERLRERADVLLVPVSFDRQDAAEVMLAFPSKLADYTSMGIPLLIVGPSTCSAVTWARQNAGVAEVVAATGIAELTRSINRLATDATLRWSLATEALRVGQTYFDHSKAQERVFSRIAVPEVQRAQR